MVLTEEEVKKVDVVDGPDDGSEMETETVRIVVRSARPLSAGKN